jgi:hypothetical protein
VNFSDWEKIKNDKTQRIPEFIQKKKKKKEKILPMKMFPSFLAAVCVDCTRRHCARNHKSDPAHLSSPTYGDIFHVFAYTHSHRPNNRFAQTFIKKPHQKLLMLRSFVDFFCQS